MVVSVLISKCVLVIVYYGHFTYCLGKPCEKKQKKQNKPVSYTVSSSSCQPAQLDQQHRHYNVCPSYSSSIVWRLMGIYTEV